MASQSKSIIENPLKTEESDDDQALSMDKLKSLVANKEVDTILFSAVDMQGRYFGKRMTGRFFLKSGYKGALTCSALFVTDIDMNMIPGFKWAGWDTGYGDFAMVPDLSTLRIIPWLPKTAFVLCDAKDKTTLEDLPFSPRAMLKQQVARLTERGYRPFFASELEFYLFNESIESARAKHWKKLETKTLYHQPDFIYLPGRDDDIMRDVRNSLEAVGIPVENSIGEYGLGQQEVNIEYTDALKMADRHLLMKFAIREIAEQHGKTVTFMAKFDNDSAGSSGHIHNSLWSLDGKTPLFLDENAEFGMSKLMRSWIAGQLKYAQDITYFFAPYINSYKRFQSESFAPTTITWSPDNRSVGFRLCGENSDGIRIECRVGGSDVNPYLSFAALIAAGLAGIDEGLELDPPLMGNVYSMENIPKIPDTLRAAINKLEQSTMLKKAFGEEVVEHYACAAKWEQSEFDKKVTDWELRCGFERY